VDNAGRVYVVDEWNSRLLVFDSSGKFLSSIGGEWGPRNGQMRNPSGVAVDSAGAVYVADRINHRVQKFVPGVPHWLQRNINGFGERWNETVSALEVFQGQFYAGAASWSDGASVWRPAMGSAGPRSTCRDFLCELVHVPIILDMIEFDGQLYASTGWGEIPGQIWRTSNGTDWEQVAVDGFGNTDNEAITAFGMFSGMLYVGTFNTTTGRKSGELPRGIVEIGTWWWRTGAMMPIILMSPV